MKTVLITGGLGFIGTNLIRHLLKTTSFSLLVLDKATYAGRPENLPDTQEARKRIDIIRGDITKRRDVLKAVKRSDMVVHMAADTHTFRSLTHAVPTMITNTIGTTMLLEASEKFGIERFVMLSSSEVYGNQMPGIPMDEEHPLNPVTPYAVSKLAADRLAYSFYVTKKIPTVILRLYNAYGPYQHPEKMVPLFITRLLKNLPISLNHGGLQKRDFVFVEDHARAITSALTALREKVEGQAFNIGNGKATPIKDVARQILKTLQKDEKLIQIAQSSQPETMGNVGVSRKAKRILGWEPQVSLHEGLTQTALWYQSHRTWWDRS